MRSYMIITVLTLLACSDKDIDTTDTSVVIGTSSTSDITKIGNTNSVDTGDSQDTNDTSVDTETDDIDTGIDTSDTDTDTSDTSMDTNDTSDTGPACTEYNSPEEEFAPIQITAVGIPKYSSLSWTIPSAYTYAVPFAGTAGSPASHEGLDYVHGDANLGVVMFYASSAGTVVYVRTGCPQSSSFHSTMTSVSAAVAGAITS